VKRANGRIQTRGSPPALRLGPRYLQWSARMTRELPSFVVWSRPPWAESSESILGAFIVGSAESLFDSVSFAVLPAFVDESDLEQANGPPQGTVTFKQEFVGRH
jgi:hypothetical protein